MQSTVHKNRVENKRELALWGMDESYGANTNKNRNSKSRNINHAHSRNYQNVSSINSSRSRRLRVLETTGQTRYSEADIARIKERRKARRRRAYFYRALAVAMLMSFVVLACFSVNFIYRLFKKENVEDVIPVINNTQSIEVVDENKIEKPDILVDLLEINDYSRPATELEEIKSIFVHYTANPGTSAKQNRSYFANLSETHERSASAHFIIGYEGEIIQCIPLDEQAYAVMTRNEDSISIECCYLDEDGKFTQETYDSLVHLLAWLKQEYNLESGDILRHYDCGGKLCPIYYVENEDKWDKLIWDVERYQD